MAYNAQFVKWNIKIFSGDTSPYPIYCPFHDGLCSSSMEIYVIIGLAIFALEKYTLPLARTDPEWMGGCTPTDFKIIIKATFKCVKKFTV